MYSIQDSKATMETQVSISHDYHMTHLHVCQSFTLQLISQATACEREMEGGRKGERARKERGMSEGEEREGRDEGGKGGNREKKVVHAYVAGVREM